MYVFTLVINYIKIENCTLSYIQLLMASMYCSLISLYRRSGYVIYFLIFDTIVLIVFKTDTI